MPRDSAKSSHARSQCRAARRRETEGGIGCQDESPGRGPAVLSVTLCWSLPSEFITNSPCVPSAALNVLNKIFNPSGDHSGSSLAESCAVWVSCVRPVPSELIVQICPPLWFSTPDQKAIIGCKSTSTDDRELEQPRSGCIGRRRPAARPVRRRDRRNPAHWRHWQW